jgi:hypothetical protein
MVVTFIVWNRRRLIKPQVPGILGESMTPANLDA